MKKSIVPLLLSCAALLLLDGCKKQSSDVWDGSNNMGSYKRAKERVLWGEGAGTELAANVLPVSSTDDDFIPLQDDDLLKQTSEAVFLQPRISPGEDDSVLPGIAGFSDPKGTLHALFRPIHFKTDDYSLKTPDSIQTAKDIAAYLKDNPKTYIFIEGHCDQRGPEGYNLSLGSKRANAVRNLLIQYGASSEQVHTISYGKEKPLRSDNNADAWAENRRAQFKIYVKR